MKVLLLQPPVQDFYETEARLQPIGLCYLKASLKKYVPAVQVVVMDFHAGRGRRTVALPSDLKYLRPYYPCRDQSPFSSFFLYYHFGAPWEQLAREVAEARPDLIGISSLFSAYAGQALTAAREIRKLTRAPIVLGGSHVSALPMQVLASPAVDYVVRGEGERPLVELVEALRSGRDLNQVPNLGFKLGGQPILNPMEDNYPLEEIPLPDFSDLDTGLYRSGGRKLAFVVTSRGCPYSCEFCSVQATFGRRYRRRSNRSIIEEILRRYQEGFRVFDFEDDNLTLDRTEMKELCRDLITCLPAGELELCAMNGLSYLTLDRELLSLMRKAGFSQLNLSLVTASAQVSAALRRPSDVSVFLEAVGEGARLGFRLVCYQILGLPGETVSSMIDTLVLLARLPVLIGASVFYLAPGSALWGSAEEGSTIQARLTGLGPGADSAVRDRLYTLFLLSRILNFLKGLDPGGSEVNLQQVLEEARRGGTRSAQGAELLERLLREGFLYAWDGSGYRRLARFDGELFRHAWSRIGYLRTLKGSRMRLDAG
jgi:radical SAM superfamily enzyme YgiQ (UPF0313 family)